MLTKLFGKAQTLVTEFKNDERGVTAIEYGLIGVAMAAVLILVFNDSGSLVSALTAAFSTIATNLGTLGS